MVLNQHYLQCLQNLVPKTEKIMRFACGMHRWYICYLGFIIVGSYYILKYISQCAFVDCNSKRQGYKPYKVVLLTNI